MRQVLRVLAAAAAGLALLSCNRPPRPQEVVYAPPPPSYGSASDGRVYVPPAPPPPTYGSASYGRADVQPQYPPRRTYDSAPYGRADVPPQYPPTRSYGSADVPPQHPPTRSYGSTPYGRADMPDQDQRLVWKSSPRWATAKPKTKTSVVKRDPQAKFKEAQAKAAEVGVENLTKEDIDGLNLAEIKQLRGY
jgi:hypothetical protein